LPKVVESVAGLEASAVFMALGWDSGKFLRTSYDLQVNFLESYDTKSL
jgi:hypothetical protein